MRLFQELNKDLQIPCIILRARLIFIETRIFLGGARRVGSDLRLALSDRRIIHVDMDSFYASCEQRDDPTLRRNPVAVGGSREWGIGAGSYEERRFSVHSAMPSMTAQRKCPDLIFVKPRFDL